MGNGADPGQRLPLQTHRTTAEGLRSAHRTRPGLPRLAQYARDNDLREAGIQAASEELRGGNPLGFQVGGKSAPRASTESNAQQVERLLFSKLSPCARIARKARLQPSDMRSGIDTPGQASKSSGRGTLGPPSDNHRRAEQVVPCIGGGITRDIGVAPAVHEH